MGAISAVWMLLARSGPHIEPPPEVELEPIEPGAWAAWAREPGPSARAETHLAPRDTCVARGRFEVNSARS